MFCVSVFSFWWEQTWAETDSNTGAEKMWATHLTPGDPFLQNHSLNFTSPKSHHELKSIWRRAQSGRQSLFISIFGPYQSFCFRIKNSPFQLRLVYILTDITTINTILKHSNGTRQVKTDEESRYSNGNWVTRPNCAIEQITWYVNAHIADTQMINPRPKCNVFCVTKKNWRLPDLHYGGKLIPRSRSRDDNDFWIIFEIWVLKWKMAIKS